MSSWQRRTSRTAYENPWIRVREDEVVRPDGSAGVYGVVEVRHPAVFVVPLTADDEVVLVEVDRYPTGDPASLEVPAGGTNGEDPLEAARRELREETGLVAEDWQEVGRTRALVGVADAPQVVYLARGLSYAGGEDHVADGIVATHRLPLAEVLARAGRGEITDDASLACLLLVLVALGRAGWSR